MKRMKSYPHIISVEHVMQDNVKLSAVTAKSALTGRICEREIPATPYDIREWMYGGETIQAAFPDLSPEDREFLLTGSTPSEWDDLFGDEEEDFE